ncbi:MULTISPECIES: protein-glutamate O-methyltransferase CheR [unclassified Pseudomonas]|uniref:CheR family methyltransferase n=1 Tax=unclassified Pseudomonas TaxID=196821 RepID=UPI000BD4A219|nr:MULTISPECIES: protein-glutamate O-methyltransferase CheR [unclassified Pseudomonas]PVZ16051.1 chemotaxis protein methyltransferase WspC [Pseudomonas sp. URIL14HWK12:I12]PVZ26093.1 chemotaxis protein methyltransferase WspC [Pseudomonas sp. URIL14HWK12:I10]PVZ36383.1 chemotaxis protein methyltransferase WspC [Pseudomonas sp. URIL14HWK12:I11]SNZ18445.1 chemotaxis protein methyltransferase WspC [Pseudomonas sp. URIL14HWK12:I9]
MAEQKRFIDFLYRHIGLDVASVGAPMIGRAVQQRREQSGAATLDDYWALLLQSASEQLALTEAVIVPETWFMRYPESFSALVGLARQRAVELGGLRPLKLLSLPCSTGEEPYSLAMALLDGGLAPTAFRVDGVDISPQSVAKAQRGVYGRNSFRGTDTAFRERHFDAVADNTWQLHEAVTRCVRLQPGNVLDPNLLQGEGVYDFVFCRNLLIYFDQATQRRVFETLKRFLHDDGVLFIGPAEGSLLASLGMRPMRIPQAFAFMREQPQAPAPAPRPMAVPPSQAAPLPRIPAPLPIPVVRAPIRPLSAGAPQTAGAEDAKALLARIALLANEGKTAEARLACEQFLREHPPQAQVFYWLGLLADVSGNGLEAQGHYRKALYLEPQHAEALAHLAMLLAAQGDAAGARRLQERAARVAGDRR